jgi:ribosomal protein S18 acetylase RimI-like enzyme
MICLSAEGLEAHLDALAELLADAVTNGASVGFLLPLAEGETRAYWEGLAPELAGGSRVLLVAQNGERIVGTVQLELATKPNARHRAEVQKLLVHTSMRRRGLARALMDAIEAEAAARRRTLLVLDTRRGDAAESLYWSCGYTAAGIIPRYAINSEGGIDDTVLFYKELADSGARI